MRLVAAQLASQRPRHRAAGVWIAQRVRLAGSPGGKNGPTTIVGPGAEWFGLIEIKGQCLVDERPGQLSVRLGNRSGDMHQCLRPIADIGDGQSDAGTLGRIVEGGVMSNPQPSGIADERILLLQLAHQRQRGFGIGSRKVSSHFRQPSVPGVLVLDGLEQQQSP